MATCHRLASLFSILIALAGCSSGQQDVHASGSPHQERPSRTCLVLSVGGAKGLAHIGAIDAIKANGVKIDCTFGNSMGAVIGSLYSSAPQEDLKSRYQRVIAEYARLTEGEARSNGLVGFLAGIGLAALSGGTVGWETIIGSLGTGFMAAMTTEQFNSERFRVSLDTILAGMLIETTAVPFATSYQTKNGEGLNLVVAQAGDLASAVISSASNPFIFQDVNISQGVRLDPGADRVSATPIEDACRTFRPTKIIAINVTGQPAFVSSAMDCEVTEVMVQLNEIKATGDVIKASGPAFDTVYQAGYSATECRLFGRAAGAHSAE